MIYWAAKAPGDAVVRTFDFTALLVSPETITGTPTIAATGVTAGTPSVAGALVSLEVSGGTLGTPGVVVCTVTTTAANTYSSTGILPIGEEPVTLAMAKSQLRYEDDDEDDRIMQMVQSAREHVEGICGIRLVPAAVTMTFAWFTDLQNLTLAPVQSITQVQYLDATGTLQTLDPTIYEFVNISADILRPRIRLAYSKQWPSARVAEDAIRVGAVVGYTDVPQRIIQAILMMVSQWFDTRQDFLIGGRYDPLPNASDALLANFRRS